MSDLILLEMDGSSEMVPLLSTNSGGVVPRHLGESSDDAQPYRVRHHMDRSFVLDVAKLEFGFSGGEILLRWIADTAVRKHSRRHTTLTIVRPPSQKATQVELIDCLIKKVAMPALDKTSATVGSIGLEIKAERMKIKDVPAPTAGKRGKDWPVSAFSFMIDGIDIDQWSRRSPRSR
jgi:hypothetical protein